MEKLVLVITVLFAFCSTVFADPLPPSVVSSRALILDNREAPAKAGHEKSCLWQANRFDEGEPLLNGKLCTKDFPVESVVNERKFFNLNRQAEFLLRAGIDFNDFKAKNPKLFQSPPHLESLVSALKKHSPRLAEMAEEYADARDCRAQLGRATPPMGSGAGFKKGGIGGGIGGGVGLGGAGIKGGTQESSSDR